MKVTEKPIMQPKPDDQGAKIGIGGMIVAALFLACVGYLVFFMLYAVWSWYASHKVISVEDAGFIKGASYSSSYWGGSSSAIQTDKGTFLVGGVFQAINGRQVRLEERGNGSRVLCEVTTNECRKLLEQ